MDNDRKKPPPVRFFRILGQGALLLALLSGSKASLLAQDRAVWKPVPFAILKFDETAPKSWNIYHTEKRGILLVRLWQRCLLIDLNEQEVYDINPKSLKPAGEDVEMTADDIPDKTVAISEWKARDVGPMRRVRFRFGKDGHFLEIQIPLKVDGKTLY